MDSTTGPLSNHGDQTDSADDTAPEELRKLRAAASSLLNRIEGASTVADVALAVDKAGSAMKLAADIERLPREIEKLKQEVDKLSRENESANRRERSERIRDYVTLLTPVITIITLAGTLITQNYQFVRAERGKQEEALDAQWRDAIKTISQSGALSPGVVALQPFLRSEKYGEQAKDVVVNLLANSSDQVFFTSLFGSAFTPVTRKDYGRIVQIDRALNARSSTLATKSWDADKRINDVSRLTPQEADLFGFVEGVVPMLTSQIGSLLKTSPPDNATIDLSAMYFKGGDWQGISLNNVILDGVQLNYTNLKGAELKGVRSFNSASFYGTAWWEARSIEAPFLEYLKANAPFDPASIYGPRYERLTQQDYDAALHRLTSLLPR